MPLLDQEAKRILEERFSSDNIMALATLDDGEPAVRYVNVYYEAGSFYSITYALSGKMQQIARNPSVALAGEWFTAKGQGENLGWFGLDKNRCLAEKLRSAFHQWIDNGHNDFNDQNTIILRIRLKSGVLFSNGRRFELEFDDE
ncbi:MAG: pyridoxamine 5'-phosphate oxidase family protein [Clostridiales bacterium]|nr:pyridoxamine 5'-phosphate oxidase family protein [Clostridiales bacterium]